MRLLPAAFAIALLVRVAYVALQTGLQVFNLSFVADDALLYLELGHSIADGRGMTHDGRPTAYVGPGYPLFLAALVRIGLDPFGIGLAQALVGAATAVLAGLAAGELARAASLGERDRRLAVGVAAFAAALYPHLVFWTGYVLTETVFAFLVASALYAWLVAARTSAPGVALGAGFLAAMAALTRPPFLAVGLGILAMLLALRWGPQATHHGRLLAAVLFAAGLAMPLGGWTARNAMELGVPILTTTEAGYIFYQGNSRGATGGTRGYVDVKDYQPLGISSPDEALQDRLYLERALRDVAEDPLAALRRLPAKAVNMWRPTYEDASARNIVVSIGTYVPVLFLGLIGAGWLVARGGLAQMPAVVIIIWSLVHLAATGMIRFRLAAELVLIEALPFGVLAVWAWGRRRTGERTVA